MTVRLLSRRKAAVLGAAVLGLVIALAVAGPAATRTDPLKMNLLEALSPPSAAHPFGTDQYGRDILLRVLAGAITSIALGVIAVGSARESAWAWGSVCARTRPTRGEPPQIRSDR